MCNVYFSACYIFFVRSQSSLLQKLSSFDIKGWTNVVAPAPEQVGSLLLWLFIHFFFSHGVCFDFLCVSHVFNSMFTSQKNGYDCGVFTCAIADCMARNVCFNFSQVDMPYFRKRLVVEIMNKRFLS